MDLTTKLRTLSRIVEPEGTVITLTLDLSKSGILPPATRIFLKDRVPEHLLSEARPAALREEFRKLFRRIRQFVEREVRPETNGFFLAAGRTMWEPMELRLPLRNFVHVGRSPYLAPILEAAARAPRAYVVRLDSRQARIDALDLAGIRPAASLEAGVRAARRSESKKTGYPGRGGAEQDLEQRHSDEIVRALLREAAASVARLNSESPAEAIYFVGRREQLGAFRAALPVEIRARVVYGGVLVRRESGFPAGVIRDQERRAIESVKRDVRGFEEGRAEGLRTALGPRDVFEHLFEGKVTRVFLDAEDPVPGVVCTGCGARTPGLLARCPFCSEDVVPTSITQEVIAHALTHPPLALTFVPPGTAWLRDLGGMAALLSAKGFKRKRVAAGR